MEKELYNMIFKRKSFHLFRNIGKEKISPTEIEAIQKEFAALEPLCADIRTEIKIVPAKETTCKRGEEYCVLMYSEKKENYLANIGYIGEQLDLYLASLNIGALWFGIGKTDVPAASEGLDFVIMIAIAKVDDEKKFRKDMFKSKRKELDEIWRGKVIDGVSDIVRFAPSACNTQPWIVENNGTLDVYRYKKPGKRGIMPADKIAYYNRVDIGIFLCFMDICLINKGIGFSKTLYTDNGENEIEKTLVARYSLENRA